MKPRRWVIVDERVTPERSRRGIEARYYSRGGWEYRVCDAAKFYSWDEALAEVNAARDAGTSIAIVPLADERKRTALRAELEGLRSTDAECSAALAKAQAAAADESARCAGWESACRTNSAREERVRAALGAAPDEPTDEAAARVARELGEAQREAAEVRRAVEVLNARVARPAA